MELIINSFRDMFSELGAVWQVLNYTWFIILPPLFYFLFKLLWMYHINTEYWLKLDWVLLEIVPPKDIEKSPKPMESLFAGMSGTEKTMSVIDEYIDGAFPDSFSLELVGDGGDVHFYIRTMKKYRHLVEGHLYAQYPDVVIKEVPDYVKDVPKIIPNSQWDLWGADIAFTRKEMGYPIRTYQQFEESVTGKMIDPLAGLVEMMGKLGPGQKIWLQWVIAATPPTWAAKEGRLLMDKLKGKEAKKENILERMWGDLMDVITNLFAALSGEVEFAKKEKKSEEPLDLRLTPGERDIMKAVEENLGKIQFSTKGRYLVLGRKENFDKTFVSAFTGGLKQFGDDNLNGFKPDGDSKTSITYWFVKPRLRYRQRKIFRRYRNRSRDGVKIIMSTEELATVFHLPDMNVMAPSISRVEAKRGGAPSNLPIE